MKHYIFLKLTAGTDPVEIQEKLWKGFRKLDDELDWLNHPVVHRSCREEDDFDLMAVIDIDGEERLGEYLAHPQTLKLEGKVEDFIAKKKVFNHY